LNTKLLFTALVPAASILACSSGAVPNLQPGIPTVDASTPDSAAPPGVPPPPVVPPMEGCGLHTQWAGDEYCIKPPPPDKGFQVHIGPSNYDSPEAQYLLSPGQETNMNFPAVSGNDQQVLYYWRQYRMRPGSHHLIVNANDGSGTSMGVGRRLGGAQNLARDNPEHGVAAPENQDIGIPLNAQTPLSVNLHYINTGDKPILQEAWVNFWYKDPSEVKEQAKELYSMGGLAMAIQPGQHTTLGRYSCAVNTAGRVLSLYGHRHANTVRFSAWRTRNGKSDLVYEDYDWHDPLVVEYNSITQNNAPDPAAQKGGATTGILDLLPGDTMDWECEVLNQTNGVLRFTNEVFNGEMCILIGDAIGPSISCQFP
jgi:hypothetical protein